MRFLRFFRLICLTILLASSGQAVGYPFLNVPGTGIPGGSASPLGVSFPSNIYSPGGGVHPSDTMRPADLITVEAPNAFSLRIKQQPADQPGYVASEPGIVTQFSEAAKNGTIGLLAHNTLAGAAFYALQPKQRVALMLANGIRRYYRISAIVKFQALQPTSVYSNFIDLSRPEQQLSSTDVFQRMYQQVDRLVFQTCIEKDGNPSWGRMFITATPEEEIVDLTFLRPWKNYYTY